MAIVKEYFGSRKSPLVGRRLYLHLSRERRFLHLENIWSFVRSWKIHDEDDSADVSRSNILNAHRAPPVSMFLSFVLNRKTMTHRLVDVARAPDDVRDRRCL